MKIKYKEHRFIRRSLEKIEHITRIAEEFQAAGYQITLRQLYYQLVSRNVIPNEKSEYDKIGELLKNARLVGLIDWDVIIDRTRSLRIQNHWRSPAERILYAAQWYRIDVRETQPHYLEVWCEKDALSSILEPICDKNDIPLFIGKGYPSITSKHDASKRIKYYADRDPIILYVGDFDPSGNDMPRDIRDKFETFGCGYTVEVRRIGLNLDQIEEHQLPPNFAKTTDTRSKKYIPQYGTKSWELDALPPDVLSNLVQQNIDRLTDHDELDRQLDIQETHRAEMSKIANGLEEGDII